MLWCSKSDHLDSFGSSSVGRVFWAEMARLRLPSARLVLNLPQHDALAGKRRTIVEAKEEDIAEEIEVETCECQHFQSNPRDMAGRRKLNIVGFYDSIFENPKCGKRG
ncbi:hypothetical protein TNCV_77331 [Trichonephila clavipes]|nr:hypothetical protein TNCV_77331 [Trichonephila clavipes]